MEDVLAVGLVHLLQEDEGQYGVWPQASVVRRETLPQREEPFVADHPPENVLGRTERFVCLFHCLTSS